MRIISREVPAYRDHRGGAGRLVTRWAVEQPLGKRGHVRLHWYDTLYEAEQALRELSRAAAPEWLLGVR